LLRGRPALGHTRCRRRLLPRCERLAPTLGMRGRGQGGGEDGHRHEELQGLHDRSPPGESEIPPWGGHSWLLETPDRPARPPLRDHASIKTRKNLLSSGITPRSSRVSTKPRSRSEGPLIWTNTTSRGDVAEIGNNPAGRRQ